MKVYRPTFKDKKSGKTKKCQHWYLTFVDNMQVRRRLPAFANKRASERAATKIEEILSTGGVLSQELRQWCEVEIPVKMRQRLIDWRIIDGRRMAEHLGKSLSQHVEDFHGVLEAKGNGATYAEQVKSRLCFIFDRCGFNAWGDIDAHKLVTFLADMRGENGIGERTFNYYLKACKQFCRWMIKERRALSSPIEHLSCVRQTENRRRRRALTLEEQRQLIAVTAEGPTHHNMTGYERALVYRLALQTGLRANELRCLTVGAFDFTKSLLTLAAAYTKNRKTAIMDLTPETCLELQGLLGNKMPHLPAFAIPDSCAKMIKVDLKTAGIPYETSEGRADFHSLRHSFITNLARAGVHPSDAQALARHSTITLTMNHYTHSVRADLRRIINEQPELSTRTKSLSYA